MAETAPVTLLPPEFRLVEFDRIDSTNAEVLRRLGDGRARHFDVVVSASQTAGRGRRGRHWVSPAGNLHLTVAVFPPSEAPAGQLAFVAALAVGEAVADRLPPSARLAYKWPNDLLVDGRKLAGVLIEGGGDATETGFAVGIGVNVAAAPTGTETPATALSHAGVRIPAMELVAPLCAGFALWYARWRDDGFAPVRSAWLARAHGIGEPVTARLPDGSERRGVFRGLDPDGALVLEAAGGGFGTVAAGEVFFAAA